MLGKISADVSGLEMWLKDQGCLVRFIDTEGPWIPPGPLRKIVLIDY